MRKVNILCFYLFLFSAVVFSQQEKHRLIILADMGNEPDEEQQMAHMLMCSNEFDLEGLIAVSGKYLHSEHHLPERQRLYPDLFDKLIHGYSKVFENLKIHATGWPEPEYLLSIVASGQPGYGMDDVGEDRSTEGSKLLIKSFENEDPRLIYIVVNAGSNTLAQALNDYKSTHTDAELSNVLKKIRVFENGAQDNAGAWICANYPEIHWTRSNYQTYAYGGPAWAWGKSDEENHKGPHSWQPYAYDATGQHQWALEHIKNHGALGGLFPLRETPSGKLAFIEGGGTIPWLGLIHRGLSDISQPSWGGWSGRFSEEKIKNVASRHQSVNVDEVTYGDYYLYTEVSDAWKDTSSNTIYNSVYAPIWRWRQAYFNDFKCRMDWCIKPFKEANHHPIAAINGDAEEKIHFKKVKAGDSLFFDASASSDPDNDILKFNWWIYKEAGTYKGADIVLKDSNHSIVKMTIPQSAKGKTIHLIFEVADQNAIAPLYDYRRVVISVQ